jgi:hypothetical protein
MPGEPHVIEIRLNAPAEMFELATTDLFSEFRNYLTGVEMCLSDLRSHAYRRPVKVVVSLPESELTPDTADDIARTLRRFCDQRLFYNQRERRALRFDGLTALRIGLPIAALGLVMTIWAAAVDETSNEIARSVADHLGWVFAWLGLWFPLDMFFFYPHQYNRESRALRQLRVAEVETRVGRPIVLS